ncbi:MAG: DUF5069 domain-containing protein [Opitutaceae bacterium]
MPRDAFSPHCRGKPQNERPKSRKFGRLARMLDKMQLHAAGRLPPKYVANLGEGRRIFFDARTAPFLGLRYDEIRDRVLADGNDAEILAWVDARGTPRPDGDRVVWNLFMAKLGWRDDRSALLRQRVVEWGLTDKPIETIFDLIQFDEGRDPVRDRAWEQV